MDGYLRAWDQDRAPGPKVSPETAAARIKIVLGEPADVINVAKQPDDPVPSKPRYWFPAKRYGWGWGPPSTWQGWVVLVSYKVFLLALIAFMPVARKLTSFRLGFSTIFTTRIAICWTTGEPLKWLRGEA